VTAEATLWQRLKRVVLENIWLKVFSLVVSIALFTVVHGSESGQRSIYVPVVAILPPESAGKILVGELPDKVKITLSGSRSVVNSINAIDAVQINLTSAPRYYAFEPSLFGLPAGIDVQTTPATLTLDWEPRQERKLAVRVQLSGEPDSLLELVGKPVVTPSRLLVKGPRPSVEAMNELPTDLLPLTGLPAGTHRIRVPLLSMPSQVSVVGPSEITVELTLEPKREQRRLKHLTVAALGITGVANVRPQHIDVLVTAPERTLNELDPEHIVPYVNFPEGTPPGLAISLPVQLRGMDENVRVIRIEPADVLVKLAH
jgi:YbbR domain-containing protein